MKKIKVFGKARVVTLLFTILLVLGVASSVLAASTYYVRTDGDDSCDGLTDAAYSGSTTDCAKKTIQAAINAASAGDTIQVAAGTYRESLGGWRDIEIFKSLNLIGAGSGQTIVELSGLGNGVEIRGTNASTLIQGITFTKRAENTSAAGFAIRVGEVTSSFTDLTFRDVEVSYAAGRNVFIDGNGTYTSIVVEDSNFHHSGAWGFSVRGIVNSLKITDSHFDDNGWSDPTHGIGFDIDMPITISNIEVTGGSFSRNKAKGINLVKTTNATFTNVDASNNGGAPGGGFGVSLWEWVSGSSNLAFIGSTFSNNSLDGFLFGTQGTTTIDNVTIEGCFINNNGRNGVFFYHNYGGSVSNIAISGSDLSNNTQKGVAVSALSSPINASGNWWGTNTPAGVKGKVTASLVDYTPWLDTGSDTSTDPGFQGNFSTLWVDDDSPQTGVKGRIQEGVDTVSGSTVNVAAGTYADPINIDTRANINLVGENRDTVIVKPTSVISWAIPGIPVYDSRMAGVRVYNSSGISISNITFDFSVIKGNHITGLLLWDTQASVSDNVLKNMSMADTSAYYEITSYVRAPSFSPTSRALVTFDNNEFIDTGRLGIVTHDYVHTIITNNTFVKEFDDFGYAMEIGSTSTALVDGNIIHGYDTPAASDGSQSAGIYIENSFTWGLSGISKNITVSNNEIYDCQWALYLGNDFSGYAGDVDIVALVQDNHFHDNDVGAVSVVDEGKSLGSSVTVNLQGNLVENNADFGYFIYTYGNGSITARLLGETILGHDIGVYMNDYASSPPSGSFYDVDVSQSFIVDNTSFGIRNDYASVLITAKSNWWGDVSGPYDPIGTNEVPVCGDPATDKNADGLGDAVSENVDYCPWLNYIPPEVDLQAVIDASCGGVVLLGPHTYSGGYTLSCPVTIRGVPGTIVGHGSPAFTIDADDVVIENLTLDGDGDTSPGILVQAGADNAILQNLEIREWAHGVQVAGNVESFKLIGNWIHDNTGAGLKIDSGVSIGGIVTIEGNLFKANGGNGIQNDGAALKAEYNSWGHVAGPASGDGVSSNVDYEPFTFAEFFLDMVPDTLATEVNVDESTDFEVALKADAASLYGLAFKISYDPTKLVFTGIDFTSDWDGKCASLSSTAGEIKYRCNLQAPTDVEWNADEDTLATLYFTASGSGLTGNGVWETYLDIAHAEAQTSAGAVGGVKVFVNNAGYGDPSDADRDITDTNDGKVIIRGIAQFTGFVDLQGRANDSGATLKIYAADGTTTPTELANATSSSSGKYTTTYIPPYLLTIGTNYHMNMDAWLYLPTTPVTSTTFLDSKNLVNRPLTGLNTVMLLGGDATNNDFIGILDASCIGGRYQQTPAQCGTTGWSDVNGDGRIDLLDLVLMGGNFDLNQSPWTP